MSISRTRIIDTRHGNPRSYVTTGSQGGYHDNLITGTSGSLRQCLDNNNKGFRKIQQAGGIVLSDCYVSRWERDFTAGHITSNDLPGWYGDMSGDLVYQLTGRPSLPVMQITSENSNALLIKAYAKMKSAAVMSGELLHDLGATVSMLRRPFSSATKLLKNMSRYRALHAGKTAKSFAAATADSWLEYRYGWKPLILDCDTVIKEAHKKRDACEKLRLVSRAGSGAERNVSGSWGPHSTFNCAGSYTSSTKMRCDVGVLYDVKSRNSSEQIGAIFGTRLSDVPATLWEIVPYSFVVDWFVNVGDWIQAVTPVPDLSVRGHWATVTQADTFTQSGSFAFENPAAHVKDWKGDLGGESVTTSSFSRTCNQLISFTPEFTANTLSILHQADAMALILQPLLGVLKGFRH